VCDVVLVEQKLHPCWLPCEVVPVSVLWQWWTWIWCCGRGRGATEVQFGICLEWCGVALTIAMVRGFCAMFIICYLPCTSYHIISHQTEELVTLKFSDGRPHVF